MWALRFDHSWGAWGILFLLFKTGTRWITHAWLLAKGRLYGIFSTKKHFPFLLTWPFPFRTDLFPLTFLQVVWVFKKRKKEIWTGGVAWMPVLWVQSPEFKPQSHQRKTNRFQLQNIFWWLYLLLISFLADEWQQS
jgi:hypothetical protein